MIARFGSARSPLQRYKIENLGATATHRDDPGFFATAEHAVRGGSRTSTQLRENVLGDGNEGGALTLVPEDNRHLVESAPDSFLDGHVHLLYDLAREPPHLHHQSL